MRDEQAFDPGFPGNTYAGGARDDRVQVLDLDGNQVVTPVGQSLEGGLTSRGD
jgi:hypothetical protein